jgi:uncharacterized GH25 family protein/thiol-disulfide isomerase/thioredoxin
MRSPLCSLILMLLLPLGAPAQMEPAVDDTEYDSFFGKVVDEAGKPVAGATVTAVSNEKSRPTTSDPDGTFRLTLGTPAHQASYAPLLVRSQDGQLGLVSAEPEKREPVRVVVKPPHQLAIRVLDRAGKPVPAAEVGILVGLYELVPLAQGRTDGDGRWTGAVPDTAIPWGVFACKAQFGFDYARDRDAQDVPLPWPARLTLTLDGARRLRVKTVDRAGRPIPGVRVGPWFIQKTGREDMLYLEGVATLQTTTDKEGMADFDWLPERSKLWLRSQHAAYHTVEHATFVKEDEREVRIALLPLERLSGRIVYADGRPAAGIRVEVAGQGAGGHEFRGSTRSGADGRYSLRVYSEQGYIVAVRDERWGAPYRNDVIVRADKPTTGIDFVLSRATRLHGRVTVGKDGRAAPRTAVEAVIKGRKLPPELQSKAGNISYLLLLSFRANTDRDGRFEFHLGPGKYTLQGPARTKPVQVAIPAAEAPAEIVRDFRMPRPETGPFAGQVVDTAGQPVAGAVVSGEYASEQTTRLFAPCRTDAQGRFTVVRSLDPLLLYARSADGTRAGVTRVAEETPAAQLTIGPLASASGRMLDLKGEPLAQRVVRFDIRIYPDESNQSWFRDCFGGTARTDAAGHFVLAGLVPGETYKLSFPLNEESRRNVMDLTPQSTQALALGELRVDPTPPLPYVPRTPATETAKAFAPGQKSAPRERRKKVLAEARRMYTRPLLLFGQPTDPACIELYRVLEEEPDDDEKTKGGAPAPHELRWEYELAALDTEQTAVRQLTSELGLKIDKGEPPILAVLHADGAAAATYPLRLDTNGRLDSAALAIFLAQHKLPRRDAKLMLAAALRQAKAEDKRVFLISSASYCGPCRRLARFLESQQTELKRHYVFVKLDVSRDQHGGAVGGRYQGKQDGGVPWYVILDAAGKALLTSNAPELKRSDLSTNIGYPSSPEGIEHFMHMLKETAPRLSAERLAELRRALAKGQ